MDQIFASIFLLIHASKKEATPELFKKLCENIGHQCTLEEANLLSMQYSKINFTEIFNRASSTQSNYQERPQEKTRETKVEPAAPAARVEEEKIDFGDFFN